MLTCIEEQLVSWLRPRRVALQPVVGRPAYHRLARILPVAMLVWGLSDPDARAEERWQQIEGKANCAVWNAVRQLGETATWTGDCLNGAANGQGTLAWRYLKSREWKEGRYTGVLRDGKRHGYGVQAWANGKRYEGDWQNNKPHGRGVYVYTSGNRYEGEIKAGKEHGYDVKIFANGDKYVGDFKDDRIDGLGVFEWVDGSNYKGEYNDSRPNGNGTYFNPESGKTYRGFWINGCYKQGSRTVRIGESKEECGL